MVLFHTFSLDYFRKSERPVVQPTVQGSFVFSVSVRKQPRRFAILKWFEDACVHVLVYSTGIARNELICGYANVVHASSYSVHTHTHAHTHARTHTHILIPFEDREPTGLKVDIAQETSSSSCCFTSTEKCTEY